MADNSKYNDSKYTNSNSKDTGNDEKMTVQEAGQKGGETTSKTHNEKFYHDIGSEGGSKSSGNFKNDPERASREGRKGAEAQPVEAKREGGRNSHSGGRNS